MTKDSFVESIFNKIAGTDPAPVPLLKRNFPQGGFLMNTSDFPLRLEKGLTLQRLLSTKAWYPLDGVKLNTPTLSLNTCVLTLTPNLVGTSGVKASNAVLRISKS